MTVRQQWLVVAGIIAVLGAGLFVAVRTLGDELFPVTIGSRAPDFRAVTVDGAPRTKTLADYKGQVVLLNIWATYCAPCKVEMPSIEKLHRSLGARGLHVVAISIDVAGKAAEVRDFARGMDLTFEILYAPGGELQQAYQTTGVPESFVIGKDGVILKKVVGADDWNSPANVALLTQLLGAP